MKQATFRPVFKEGYLVNSMRRYLSSNVFVRLRNGTTRKGRIVMDGKRYKSMVSVA